MRVRLDCWFDGLEVSLLATAVAVSRPVPQSPLDRRSARTTEPPTVRRLAAS